MGSAWAQLGLSIGGAIIGGIIAGPWGARIGFLGAGLLSGMLFKEDYESKMPSTGDYQMQSSAVGTSVPIVIGVGKTSGNIVYMGSLVPYQVKHSSGGGKGGGDTEATYETKYRRSFIIAICEGPAYVLRCWKGKKEININTFTQYSGINNVGISTLIDKDYAEYNNVCLVYFENYDLGNSQGIPNFVFEVSGIPLEYNDLIVGGLLTGSYSSFIFGTSGSLIHNLSGTHGTQFKVVTRVIRHPINKYIYILCDDHIEKWDDNGNRITAFGSPNGYVDMGGIGTSDLSVDSAGFIYVGIFIGISSKDTLLKVHPDTGVIVWTNHSQRLARGVRSCYCHSDGNLYISSQFLGTGIERVVKIDTSNGSVLKYYTVNNVQNVILDEADFLYSISTDTTNVYKSDNAEIITSSGSVGSSALYAILVKNGINPPITTEIYVAGVYDAGEGATIFRVNPNDFSIIDKYNTGSDTVINHLAWDADGTILASHKKAVGDGGKDCHVTVLDTSLNFIHGYELEVDTTYYSVARAPLGALGSSIGEDVNFGLMIKTLLINERYGGYLESDLITEDFDSIITYCDTNNLKGSVIIKDQRPLTDWISYICSHFQGFFYEIGGKVGLNSYRDQASVLSITKDDLIREGDSPPVRISKRKYDTTYNRIEGTFTDKDNDYKTGVVTAFDRIDQRESGQVRTKTIDIKAITDKDLAAKMIWRIFIDQFYRFSQYTFTLGYKSMLLEVGDVIDVTDGYNLVAQKMRVMNVAEEKDGRRAVISATEDVAELYPSLTYQIQQNTADILLTITLADGTITFRENTIENKLHLSIVPGNDEVNGYYVYRSYDDASYVMIGRATIDGVTSGDSNSIGTIQSILPAYHTVTYRGDETLTVSIGTVTDLYTATTDEDFFNKRKLAKIGNEIIAYKTCVESSVAGIWQITGLIRGLFGTIPVAHVSGEVFATLDSDFSYLIQESDIGKTLYFKVVSFYADEIQAISDVTGQSYTVLGNFIKSLPVSLMRINNREGLTTYKTNDVIIDWYFCSKITGFGRGGYGNALWGAYTKYPLLEYLKVELEEIDGTPIIEADFILDNYGEPKQLEILEVDKNGKNPIVVKLSSGSSLLGSSREITIEKI